jgi:hypothetical protein
MPTAVEGLLRRLALWVRVVTRKELDESKELDKSGAVHTLDLDTWERYRQELDRLGGPPDQPDSRNTSVLKAP